MNPGGHPDRWPRSRARWVSLTAAAAALCVLLTGCGSLMNLIAPKDEAPAAQAAPAPERLVYRVEVVGAPAPLRRLLMSFLDIARFQQLPETETITLAELDRLAGAAPAQARSLLETEGYFNPVVSVTREPATSPDDKPLIRLSVDPGPRTVVRGLELAARGELQTGADAGDALARASLASMHRGWPLKPGTPFRQADWDSAKSNTLAQLRANGYAAASWDSTSAQVDADANSVKLFATADSGPLFRLGEIRIEGLKRYPESAVRNLAGFRPGTPYSEKLLLDFQERLQKGGLFEGVVAEIEPVPEQAGDTPVKVRVRELQSQQTTIGVGISANTGERVTVDHLQRRVFDRDWQARNKVEIGRDLSSWQGQLTSYPLENQWRNLIAGTAEQLRAADETRNTVSARIGRTRETERMDRLYYAELQRSTIETPISTTRADAASLNYHWISRHLDNVLLPTAGTTASLQLAGGYARSDTEASGLFTRTLGRLTFYRPLGGGWYGQARVEAGQVFAASDVGIPDTLLFRAGGDDSVRGYAYRTLGPNENGVVVSGRVMATGSVEVARPILTRLPTLWGAAFIDAGNAAQNWGEFSTAVGYGVGLRLRSPVGPVRVDLAYGQRVERLRLHLSVGITF